MEFKEEYKAFNNRINEAQTTEQLQRLEKSLTRLFDAGIFSPSQYSRLDIKLMDKGI